jgi:hypothetical protein
MSEMRCAIRRLGANRLSLVVEEERNGQQQTRQESQQAEGPLISQLLEHLAGDCRDLRCQAYSVPIACTTELTQRECSTDDVSHEYDSTQRAGLVSQALRELHIVRPVLRHRHTA